jgi:hypothetical protein
MKSMKRCLIEFIGHANTFVMFYVGKWPWDLIICLLEFLKCNFVLVDVAMFHVERPCEVISYIPGIQKSFFDEVGDVIFQVGKWPWKLIICRQDVLKCDFVDVDRAMFQGVGIMRTLFLHSGNRKKRLGRICLSDVLSMANGPENS